MRILVTGSGGCVGSALRQLPQDQHEWIFLNRSSVDLTDRTATIDKFKQTSADYVVHLASYVPGFYNIDSVAAFRDNVRINENVLEACYEAGIMNGMVLLSVNMFSEPMKFPIDESMLQSGELTGPMAGYGYAKRMMALQCENYHRQHGINLLQLIPCNIYGPNDNLTSGRLVPNLIQRFKLAVQNNEDVVINGTGQPLRQFIFSIDLAKLIRRLVSYQLHDPLLCCGDEEVTIQQLAEIIGSIVGFTGKIIFDSSKPDGIMRKSISNQHLIDLLGSVSFIGLKDGLKQTMELK